MYVLIIVAFILGYAAIALEHPLKLDKAASALFTAVACWVLLILGRDAILDIGESHDFILEELMHHLGEISGILFFLLGAMSIVELVDAHDGFSVIIERIKAKDKRKLLIILGLVTFFMSAVLDNLTTAIVMATLIRKIIPERKDLWLFAGIVIIAANAGGAWSPIGDVTTIMLWIGGQISAVSIVKALFIPSLICLLVPLILIAMRTKGTLNIQTTSLGHSATDIPKSEKRIIFFIGVGALLFVPVFKAVTGLPPFMGILLGLSILWIITEILHKNKVEKMKKALSIASTLQKIDTPSILFFLGILLAVSALQTAGHLSQLATYLDESIGNIWIINSIIGLFSAIVDNVPLVAGAIGMYDLSVYSQDHIFWQLLALSAGTGGSVLIIGSAAGVAIMGILKIDFIWYVKNIALMALIGYLSGILSFWLIYTLF